MRRFSWLLVAAIAVFVVGCSDDGDNDRSDPPRTSTTVAPPTTTSPGLGENAACALVTQQDAEAVFGGPARPGAPEAAGDDAVCLWQAGDDGEGQYQLLEFRLHEGSSLESRTTNTGGGITISVQRAQGDRVFAFRYLSTGAAGDAGTKQQAVDELADSVIARAE